MFTCVRHRTDMVSNTCDVDGDDSGDDDDDGDLTRSVSIT